MNSVARLLSSGFAARGVRRLLASRQTAVSQNLRMDSSTPKSCASYDQVDAEAFINELMDKIREKRLYVAGSHHKKVVEFVQPLELEKILDMPIRKEGAKKDEMLALCEKIIHYSVKSGHPHFYNQFYVNADTYSLGAAYLVESLNANQHTFEVAPVFILAERYLLKKVNSFVKFPSYDGVFIPGGSLSNMMAVQLARYNHNKDIKSRGLFGSERLVMFTSADAHYSLKKAANFMGFGIDSCIMVDIDARGRMDPNDLQNKVKASKEKGDVPFFVMATSGSTVLGSYDSLNEIADVCQEHDLWMHVDGAWGGGVIVSEKHGHLMDGIHRANSFVLNFHKLFRTALQCSCFLVNDPTILQECNGLNADYLFQPDKCYDTSFDLGDKTVQCGRKADAMKAWIQWRARGDDGQAWAIDHAMDNANYLTERLREHDGFRLTIPEFQFTNICFWYIPPSMRGQPETDEWWQKIHKVTAEIKQRMVKEGTMMIGYQPLKTLGFVNFFRIIISKPELTYTDMDFVITEIDRLGRDL